jgi:hypothetical protein
MSEVSLTDQFHSQNLFLQNLMDKYSANNTKINYVSDNNDEMVGINSILFFLYLIIAIIFSVILFISPKWNGVQAYKKLIISLAIILLPFYVVRLETYAYSLFIYLRDLLYGNTYLRRDY